MAELDTQAKVISKKNEGFPAWLDFDKLRQEGIDYLGELSGNIWTDHNAHDPGISILEVLCYALLDLGYRTSLPAKDLFAKDPDDSSAENNFFTPAAILGCNPLTITDYRKLLVDVPGVKNAWLVPAEDITIASLCGEQEDTNETGDNAGNSIDNSGCLNFLNGLYHVYLDVESNVRYKNEVPKGDTARTVEDVIDDVRSILMAHRNLCEDFFDIRVLCKQKIGVCADIELRADADPEKVFVKLIEKLREFLSPAPRFYRLKQLLEKGKSIEEIFEGRPIDLVQSHGFVDVEEFEKITLQKEIHISDVYNAIFSVEGIASVKKVKLRNSDGSICLEGNTPWVFKLYKDHVPELDLLTSGFTLSGSRGNIVMDTAKFAKYLEANPYSDAKALMFPPSANLDVLLEQGNYRKELADYYPVENDFPKVYGIAEGSLPDDASAQRKAQALQLRGYLLFFDTLLSGYLSQLKNIRNIFALDQKNTNDQHTYFINKLSSRPGLEQLVTHSLADATQHPTTQAIPVCKEELDALIVSGKIDRCNGEKEFTPYKFCSMTERDVAIHQLVEDLKHEIFTEYLFTNNSGCWSFYFFTSSEKFAIVGKEFYQRERDARNAMNSLRYLCTNEKSFKRYTASDKNKFSFNVVSSITGYWNYLSLLTENEKLFLQRRNGLLDHLLARFAETFTDYTLLSYSFLKETSLQQNNMQHKERFLSAYPELSSMRGKAYDYLRNGWNNSNVSGVEKRFEGYAGIGLGKQENICHFEVAEFEEQTMVNIQLKDKTIIASNSSFQSREEGIEALNLFLKAAADPANYAYSKSTIENLYEVTINVGANLFRFPAGFETEAMASEAGGRLQRMFALDPTERDILPSQFEHTLVMEGTENRWTKKDPVINREQSFRASADALERFGDTTQWIPASPSDSTGTIKFNNNPDKPDELIDINAFEPYENRVDVRKSTTIYKYTVSDRDRNFFFISESEFEGETLAHENLLRLLFMLANPKHYRVKEVSTAHYVFQIFEHDQLVATNTIEFQSEADANAIIDGIVAYIKRNTYHLHVNTKPVRWKFELKIAIPNSPELLVASATEYNDPKVALAEAGIISESRENIIVTVNKKNELELRRKKDPQKILALAKISEHVPSQEAQDVTETFLSFKKTIGKIHRESNAPEGQKMVVPDAISKMGNFGYRLVKKDGYHAWYNIDGDFPNGAAKAKKITAVYKLYASDEKYLQLNYGDRNVVERKHKNDNTKWYHFRIVTRETDNHPNGIVLFESVIGYRSVEEAQKAFEEQHVQILSAAKDERNYGGSISFDEVFLHSSGDCNDSKAQVFIPAETMKLYGHNTDYARRQLVALSSTYPIQSIKKSDPDFTAYFLCDEKPKPDRDDNCCCDENEEDFYYFKYKLDDDKNGGWISHAYFTTANEAMRKFNFFLMLLRYKGNYIIHRNECDCRWRLSIREILAEGSRHFKTPQDAWGKEGVEKFICTSQSAEAFSLYQHDEGCCYSFFVACSNMGLIHPCTYDSSVKRDKALQRLYAASRRLFENKQKENASAEWEEMVNVFKQTNKEGARGSWCERAVELSERFFEGGDVGLNNKNDEKAKEKLKAFAYYFPVRRKKLSPSSDQYRYYLHINLPGFHDENEEKHQPCGCEPDLHCCTPWVSECCFTTCDEALRYYYNVIECLADKDHYFPVMDCNCNTYGIRFYCGCKEEDRQPPQEEDPNRAQPEGYKAINCCGEIVAFNPQCYTTPAMACEAIGRAKGLINAEGLHLVEHILLRPHCHESDCNCIIDSCPPETCLDDFKWNLPDDDPCEKGRSYCFVPGADPYSFIATVVLPAWPERFRKKENRQLVEKLLYRETPAHILLRVLWLPPYDFCQFESIYHQWTKWIAVKPACVDYEPACKLIAFLFNYNLHCFECAECEPCLPGAANDPCGFLSEAEIDPNVYVNEINNLYCWNTICAPQVVSNYRRPESERDHAAPVAIVADTLAVDEVIVGNESIEEAERRIDARFEGYRQAVTKIRESSGNVNAGLAASFLHHGLPDFESYKKVIEAVVANKRLPENRRLLSMNEKKDLVQAVTWNYLDRNVLKRRISDNESDLRPLFQMLHKKELLPDYKKWKSAQLTKVEREAPVHEVKKLFDKL